MVCCYINFRKNNKSYRSLYEKIFIGCLFLFLITVAEAGHYAILDNSGLDMYDKKLYTTKNSVASVFYIDDKKKTVKQVFLKDLGAYFEVGSNVIYDLNKKEILVSFS